jgi:hypothetical protein
MENKEPSPEEESRAAIELWNTTCQLVFRLHAWANARPELFRIIAHQMFFWPAMVSHKRGFAVETADVLEKIELGKNCPYRNDTRWRINEPATQFAIYLYLLAKTFEKQWQLPPLSDEKSKRVWFDRACRYLDETGFNWVQHPVLSKLANRAVARNPKADECRAIKDRLWEACDNVIAVERQK